MEVRIGGVAAHGCTALVPPGGGVGLDVVFICANELGKKLDLAVIHGGCGGSRRRMGCRIIFSPCGTLHVPTSSRAWFRSVTPQVSCIERRRLRII